MNVVYAHVTEGRPAEEVERIDKILAGETVAERHVPSPSALGSTSPDAMRALMAAAKMPQAGGGTPRKPPQGTVG